jgi:hypothetical protein
MADFAWTNSLLHLICVSTDHDRKNYIYFPSCTITKPRISSESCSIIHSQLENFFRSILFSSWYIDNTSFRLCRTIVWRIISPIDVGLIFWTLNRFEMQFLRIECWNNYRHRTLILKRLFDLRYINVRRFDILFFKSRIKNQFRCKTSILFYWYILFGFYLASEAFVPNPVIPGLTQWQILYFLILFHIYFILAPWWGRGPTTDH